ncbi:methyltransferase [Cnuibacter physcomitrellae]|uniref:SAM-dependent methyltransferase n=1 Tax=Cnuibacter physcomitrellae TaxID=1619308 RepID=A0A1X9LW78_9MICO|nr:N-6 DNA methylase [Cnuibacter physcomitrellae]ARJ07559.1 SAM-dependent methyltransferase [Cnuibacter physcomitrellae]GGI42436.1 methyltransferase [Cnuibacter physcomitrellae]
MLSDSPDLEEGIDSASARKARGAFFTPSGITEHIVAWAIRGAGDHVLEPSTGEAAFLTAAVKRLTSLGTATPVVHGVEIHPPSALAAEKVVQDAGGRGEIAVQDFFLVDAVPEFDAIIGNPPFIRYQEWTGAQRDRARFAALQQGVALTGLSSSWAAFVVHSAGFLKPGGRLGLVLPAELLSVNYAAPVRRFLLERFASVELVVFDEQVFPDAEADTVLVKADGWGQAPSGRASLRQTRNAATLDSLEAGTTWAPISTADRWTPLALSDTTESALRRLSAQAFVPLSSYGDVSLGAVTGGNRFFALSPSRVRELGIPRRDLLRISPPGSGHLRGLALTDSAMTRLGQAGQATWLLYPSNHPAEATKRYIELGHATGVDTAYKCRVRIPWWKVPVLAAPDLLLTYMNADTARLTTNAAGVRHLNSVHGVYIKAEYRDLARSILPIASLNSLTLLSAEMVGRSYGGGILKIEPREADRWWMPAIDLLARHQEALIAIKPRVQRLLQSKRLAAAVAAVDDVLFAGVLEGRELDGLRADHAALSTRRTVRGRSSGQNI